MEAECKIYELHGGDNTQQNYGVVFQPAMLLYSLFFLLLTYLQPEYYIYRI